MKEFNQLNERVVELENVNGVRGKVIEPIQEENVSLKKEIKKVREHASRNEQKSRTHCLLLHGNDESTAESTDNIPIQVISEHLGVDLSLGDIERSHKIPPPPPPLQGRSLFDSTLCGRICLRTKRNKREANFNYRESNCVSM